MDNRNGFENHRDLSLHRFESCTLRFHLAEVLTKAGVGWGVALGIRQTVGDGEVSAR